MMIDPMVTETKRLQIRVRDRDDVPQRVDLSVTLYARSTERLAAKWRELRIAARIYLRDGRRDQLLDDLGKTARRRRGLPMPDPADDRATLSQLWQSYAAIKLPENAPKTRADKAAHWENHIAPVFGNVAPDTLTALQIESWRAGLLGSGLTPKTIDNITTTLRTLTKWATARGYLDADPGQAVKLLRRPGPEKRRHLEPDESIRLLEWMAEHLEPRQRFAIGLSFLAGLRLGELIALEKSDLDATRGVLTVRRAYTRPTKTDKGGVKETKGKQTRSVGLPLDFAAELFRWTMSQPGQLLIPSARGRRLTHWSMRDWVTKACAGAEVYPITPHGLRHSTGAYLISKGLSQAEVARYLGHKQTSTTERYTHSVSAVEIGRRVWRAPK